MPEIPIGYRRLEDSERRRRKGARLVGPAHGSDSLSVTVRVRRRKDAPALPGQEYWCKTRPGKRKFFSRAEFAARYGAAQTDLDRVASFARDQKLSVVEMSVGRRLIILRGTVDQMNRVFAVELGRFETPGETYRGREGYIYMPKEIGDLVEGVFGLDNRKMARRASNGGPFGANPLTPPQVANLYNFPPSNQFNEAAGQTVGILEFGGGYNIADINAFCTDLHLPLPNVHAVPVDGASTVLQGSADFPDRSDIEVALDVEIVASIALKANIAIYFAPDQSDQSWIDALTKAISGEGLPAGWAAPSVLSCSWGWPEVELSGEVGDQTINWSFEWTAQAITAVSSSFEEAASQGVTVFVATGDAGTDAEEGDGLAHVQYPSTDPWVTACGGTIITGTSPLSEGTWNDSDYPPYTGATGGGISEVIPVPSWQAGIVPNSVNPPGTHQGRGVPDVAGNASYYSGYILSIYGTQTSELVPAAGPGGAISGTSAVPPLYSALVALLNASLPSAVGYLNPTLYQIAQTAGQTVLRDINDGISNAYNGAPGYTSGPGWDACTGWGVINGAALWAELVETALQTNPGCMSFVQSIRQLFGM
jgi:kumamolisin